MEIYLIFVLCMVVVAEAIVDGIGTVVADHPHMGYFKTSDNRYRCGCIMIHPKWALTAGHCGGDSTFLTHWGNQGLIVTGVRQIIRHPDYGTGPGRDPNDISVIDMDGSIISHDALPIEMASYRLDSNPGAVIVGYGATCPGCTYPGDLHAATIPVIDNCGDYWGDMYYDDVHICVFDGQAGACDGDSGSSLVYDGVLHGIASWTSSTCDVTQPSVYTRINTYQPWVCEVTNNDGEGCEGF